MHSLSSKNLNQHCTWIASNPEQFPPQFNQNLDSMMARYPVFVEQAHIEKMDQVIKLITEISQLDIFQKKVFRFVPEIAAHPALAKGVLFGYDFHISEEGPKLIEINTNAGAIFFNYYLNQSQTACCDNIAGLMTEPTQYSDLANSLLQMFQQEFKLQHPQQELKTIAIVDESPETQFLLDEFHMFKQLFEAAGITAYIADPSELSQRQDGLYYRETHIDLIYNRHTDFYLETDDMEHIKRTYEQDQVVLTPNPRAYATAADKRLLTLLSDKSFLDGLPISEKEKSLLLSTIPSSMTVSESNSDDLWKKRKQYFFKPTTGHGSKATYAGSKLSKKTWNEQILKNDYIAQSFVPPSRRFFELDGEQKEFKVDLRNYVYDGETLLLAARLYRGQATNMRTIGGGFATVYATKH